MTQSPAWSDRVIPLPKEIRVSETVRVRAGDILVECSDRKSVQSRAAVNLLRASCLSDGNQPAFGIRLLLADDADGYADPSALERLQSLPNADQAYHIEPTSQRDGLLVIANSPLGLLFAARTLVQLMHAPAKTTALTQIEIPLVTITDWPDIAERGQWGGDVRLHIAETSQYKLNVIEDGASVNVDDKGEPVCRLKPSYVADNLALGVKIVPFISHLEQISRYTGLMSRSDVISKPDPSKPLPSDYVPGLCMSSPATRAMINGWIEKIAEVENVTDIMVWLSENASPCFCDQCMGKEPFGLEVDAISEAYREVKKSHPNVRLRILTTQGSYSANDRILAAAPRDMGVSYYDGGRTYDSSRKPMIYPLLENFAKSGRWLGVYPQITHSWRTVFPWTAPQFIKFRAQEFADKELSNVIGYAVPSNYCHDFNVLALAEWTWNAHGRSPEEFSRVYALKRGISDPDLFAEWATLAGDAGWSLAESKLLLGSIYNPTFGMLSGVPFDHRFQQASILDVARLDDALAKARKALELARKSGNPDMIGESECVLAGLEAFAAVRSLSSVITKPTLDEPDKKLAADSLDTLDRTSEILREQVLAWGERIRKRAKWSKLPSRLIDTAYALLRTCDDFRVKAVQLGVTDPRPERRLRKVGEWSAADFANGPNAALRIDITDVAAAEGGTYQAAFDFIDSAYGTDVKSCRVIERVGDADRVVATSSDPLGRMSVHERHKEVRLNIPARAEGSRLFLEVELTGLPKNAPSDRRTCSGRISIRRVGGVE